MQPGSSHSVLVQFKIHLETCLDMSERGISPVRGGCGAVPAQEAKLILDDCDYRIHVKVSH